MNRATLTKLLVGLTVVMAACRPAPVSVPTRIPTAPELADAPEPVETPAPQGTVVRGTIVGSDGQPLEAAEVRLRVPGWELDEDIVAVSAAADGGFELVTDVRGIAVLEFTGTDHASHAIPTVLDGSAIELSVRLGTFDALEGAEASVEFADPSSLAAAIPAIELRRAQLERDMWWSSEPIDEALKRAWSRLEADIADEPNPRVRRGLSVVYFSFGRFLNREDIEGRDPVLAIRLLRELEPSAPLWSIAPTAMWTAVEATWTPDHYAAYVDSGLRHHDPQVAGALHFAELWSSANRGDVDAMQPHYEALQDESFASTPYAKESKLLSPDHPLLPGKKLPAFVVQSLDGKTEYTPERLAGKVTLIDLWATWCPPCLADMPTLHRVYEQHRDDVQFLSISFDRGPEEVVRFRAGRWAMPWLHALAGDAEEALGQAFAMRGIPTMVLVDETGTILAATPFVQAATLEQTLARTLEKRAAE